MQASFMDLVGTVLVPTHCFDSDELKDLIPALDMATADHGMGPEASEAQVALAYSGTLVQASCC